MERVKNYMANKMAKVARKGMDAMIKFKNEEAGASELVVVVILIVIVLAVAAVFKEKLMEVIEGVFGKVLSWING
ncbi:MAG: hypothetical protein J6I58_06415 [Eubacterium sp.]|nr:hypothetical protein [Eubacterium sp.]